MLALLAVALFAFFFFAFILFIIAGFMYYQKNSKVPNGDPTPKRPRKTPPPSEPNQEDKTS